MRVYAYAAVTLAAGVAAVATVTIDAGTVDYEAVASVTLDGTPGAIAVASAGTVQEAGMEVVIGGATLSLDYLIGSLSVDRNRRESVQQGHFEVPLSEWGTSPLGDPFATLGPPTGLREVEFWGCYRDDATGTVYRYPLLKRGLVDNTSRDSGPQGHVEVHEVLDVGARWPRIPASLVLPPGHGLTTGRITEKALREAGETLFHLEAGDKRYKEFQLVEGDAVAAAQEVNDIEGRVLRWDRYGRAVNPRLEPDSYTAAYAIDESQILEVSAVRVTFPPDVITKVTATGEAQVTEEPDAPCGDVIKPPIEQRVHKTFVPWNAGAQQNGACGFSTLTPDTTPLVDALFSLTIARQVTRCGVVKHEETESWGYFVEEAARYQWTSGTRACVNGVYLQAGAAADDGLPAYIVRRAYWAQIGETSKDYYYDAPGWTGPFVLADNDRHLMGSPTGEETGRYLGSISRGRSFYNPQRANKVQSGGPGVPFDELDPDDGYSLGNGLAVRDAFESLMETSRVVELVRSSSETGYIESQRYVTSGYAIVPNGQRCQYTDGSLSEEDAEQYTVVEDALTSYAPAGENTHIATTLVDRLGETPVQTAETVASAPPAVDFLPGYEPASLSASLDETDLESGVEARAGETRPLEVVVTADEFLSNHLPREVTVHFPYAEDEDELHAAAVDMIRESAVIKATLTLAANYLLSEGLPVLVTHHASGIGENRRGVIDAITWDEQPGQPRLTTVAVDFYPTAVTLG